jgi:hypothetical protein
VCKCEKKNQRKDRSNTQFTQETNNYAQNWSWKISQGKLLWGEMVVLLDVTDKPEQGISCLVDGIICSNKMHRSTPTPEIRTRKMTLRHEVPQPRITWGLHSGGGDDDSRPLGNDNVWSGKCLTCYTICQSTQCRITEDMTFHCHSKVLAAACPNSKQLHHFTLNWNPPLTIPKHSISFQSYIFIALIISIVTHNNQVTCWPHWKQTIWENNIILTC